LQILITKIEYFCWIASVLTSGLFFSNRYYFLVLLPRIRDDILNNKKLNWHLYMSLKKALFKPDAFYKGILFPLIEVLYYIIMVIINLILTIAILVWRLHLERSCYCRICFAKSFSSRITQCCSFIEGKYSGLYIYNHHINTIVLVGRNGIQRRYFNFYENSFGQKIRLAVPRSRCYCRALR
jgi:hypothetical protein